MKKLLIILALAGVISACNGNTSKEEEKPTSRVESVAKKLVDAAMNNDAEMYLYIEMTECKDFTEAEKEELKQVYDRLFDQAMRESLGM